MLIAVGVIGVVILVVPLGLCAGVLALLSAETRAYHEQYLREQAVIAPILASNPAFKDLEVHEYSGGGAYITGRVDRQQDIENLRSRLEALLEERRAEDLIRGVHARENEQH